MFRLFVVAFLLIHVGLNASSTGNSKYVKVGCFEDRFHSRALPELIANYRGSDQFDWFNLDKYVKKCAEEAKKRNYMFFGIQFYGECWSGVNAALSYDKYGPSPRCIQNVGMDLANFVYRFVGEENECLHYTILKSSDRASTFKLPTGVSPSCDKDLPLKWYRFMLPAGTKIASTCIPSQRCNTVVTGWMKTPHPKSTDGIDSGEICFRWQSNCCNWSQKIYVRNCGRVTFFNSG